MVTVVPSSNLLPRTHKAGWRLPRVIKCVLGDNMIYHINSPFLEPIQEEIKNEKLNELWRMNFDGAYSRAGKGAGIIIISPEGKVFNCLLKPNREQIAIAYILLF